MSERFCPTGNHFRAKRWFRLLTNGKMARSCHDCECAVSHGRKTSVGGRIICKPILDGVDIDAIHYKLGAVRKHGT